MTREFDTDIEQAAVQWHVQVLAGSADWDAFARWLDEAPDHQPAYDRIAMIDAEVEAHVREFGMPELTGDSDMGAHDIEPVGRTRRWCEWIPRGSEWVPRWRERINASVDLLSCCSVARSPWCPLRRGMHLRRLLPWSVWRWARK